MTINRKTAQLLNRVAAVFRVKEGDSFRVRAYNNAAAAIENLPEPIDQLWKQNQLDTIPGVGHNLIAYLDEYFSTGQVKHFDSQLKKVPSGMFSLMDIRGVGPVTAYKIASKFHLRNEKTAISDLRKLLKTNQLTKIKSFKAKTIERIASSLKHKPVFDKNRMLLSDAILIAERYLSYLRQSPSILFAEPLGSLRRRLPTVGDIDIAICAKDTKRAMEYALKFPEVVFVPVRGDKVSRVKLIGGSEVDLKLSLANDWGSMLQHYTGSKMHNIHLRNIAIDKGLSLSEYGIRNRKTTHQFRSEKSFYAFLGLTYIPPEIREDGGELELASNNKIPQLIELDDIKGDMHVHSDFKFPSSHDIGESKVVDLLAKATSLNYQYLGITDHNPKFLSLSEQSKKLILTKRKKYLYEALKIHEKSVKKRPIKLLIGLEVDIRPDGNLALSDNLMSELDYAIVSVHSGFEKSKEDNTRRIISGLSHPKAMILGHPTGRILNRRDPINADWTQIFQYCLTNQKFVEVNGYPDRLDLSEDLIRQACTLGVQLVINTDSHQLTHLEHMRYGVWQARRGYATKKDVINTLPWKNLQAMLKLNS